MNSFIKQLALFLVLAMLPAVAAAQDPDSGFSLMAGQTQYWLFGGGNLAVQYASDRWVFEYSHGFSLKLNRQPFALTQAERDEALTINVPWTTGGGVGLRFLGNWHVLLEVKVHRYDIRHSSGQTASYTTYSVGPGIFYTVYLWKRLVIQPNVRWWPNVGSSLIGNRQTFVRADGTSFDHAVHDFGLFANVNLGWTF